MFVTYYCTMDNNIKILSMNCQGLGDQDKRKDVFHFLKQKKFSIYLLQDTHFTSKEENFIRTMWGFECFFDSFSSNSRGVAVLLNNTFEYKLHKIKRGNDGNKLILDITIQDKRLTLINLYGPNKDKPNFYREVKNDIDNFGNETVVIGADFNLILDFEKDCKHYLHVNNPRSREAVLDLCAEENLIDIWRECNLEKEQFTWKKVHPFKQARLDFFLISELLFTNITNTQIEPGYRTDHSAITLTIKFQNYTKGNSYWKFNNTLLKDQVYVAIVKDKIKTVKEQYSAQQNASEIPISELVLKISDQLFFDTLLMEIRGKTISYSSYKKKSQDQKEFTLLEEIKALEEDFDPSKENSLKEKQKELFEIRQKKLEGVKIRSRARWVEDGEKVSKYFCNLENRNFISKMMPNLVKEDGSLTVDQTDIINETKLFYENLYSYKEVDEVDLDDILNFEDIPKLNENQKLDLEGKITLSEALHALKNMANNKSPGSDGFTVEFFKFFWKDIGELLVRAINCGFETGELSSTQKEGIITCIPKGGKPKQFLKNWRPISLLNVSYKIASASISNRLKKILPQLINNDQTGFLSGRYIGENIRTLYDLIAHTEKNNIPGLLLLIDFEKAFDSVAWSFIHKVLDFFNFGEQFKRWISVFYKNTKSCVTVNGHLSSWFKLERGCRQGDPLSPYIFILCVEILAHLIRKNSEIKGIKIHGREYLVSQYADDTSLILEATEKSLKNALNIITYYSKFSGLSMNHDKTRVIWLGPMKGSAIQICQEFDLNWDQDHFTVLGVKFSTNLHEVIDLNFTTKIRQIKDLLLQWSKRNLTPFGKITVIKTLAMTKINHLLIALPSPPLNMLKDLQSMFFKFIWGGPRDRIKRKVCTKDYGDGGLRMFDIFAFNDSLKVTWIRRILNADDKKWVNLLEAQWPDYFKFVSFGENFIKSNVQKLNSFWKDVFRALCNFLSTFKTSTVEQFLNEPIWYNIHIKRGGKTVYNNNLFISGVRTINDLIGEDGNFLRFENFCELFGVNVNFLEYSGIIAAIENYKREKLTLLPNIRQKLRGPNMPEFIRTICKEKKGCRKIYKRLSFNNERPTSIIKWENEFGRSFENFQWHKMFKLPFILTSSTTTRWFQTRLIHRILSTNTFLTKIGIKQDNKCSFCNDEPETLTHLFWSCPIVSHFWNSIFQWLRDKCVHIHTLQPEMEDIILGIIDQNKADLTLNFILLCCKQFIYNCRTNHNNLETQSFQKWLKTIYNTEKYIAFKNCRWEKFNKRWLLYRNLV